MMRARQRGGLMMTTIMVASCIGSGVAAQDGQPENQEPP